MKKKIAISFVFGSLLSVVTLYLAFRHVPLSELVAYLGKIDYWWLLPSEVLVLLTFILRVIRWQIILKDADAVPFWQAFHPLMIGFMMNCILPMRSGELARPALLKKDRGVPLITGLATVAAERVFDIILLLLLFLLTSSTIFSRPDLDLLFGDMHLNNQTLQAAVRLITLPGILLLLIIALLTISATRELIIKAILVSARHLEFAGSKIHGGAEKLAQFAIRLIENFTSGMSLVLHPQRISVCFGLSILIWILTAFSYYVFALGCPGIQLSFIELTTVMVVVCFFIALPSVPGFWGLWEAGGIFALSLFGVATKDAAGFTLMNHAVQMFPVIVVGLVSAFITSVNILNLSRIAKSVAPPQPLA